MKTYEKELKSALIRTAEAAFARTREVCPVKTGRLKRSLSLTLSDQGAVIATDVIYAAAVEFGLGYNVPRHYMGAGAALAADRAAEIFADELFGDKTDDKTERSG